MNVQQHLEGRFGASVRLDTIAEEFLGISAALAVRRWKEGKLSLPIFQLRDSTRAPWWVRTEDLAGLIEEKAMEAGEHERGG